MLKRWVLTKTVILYLLQANSHYGVNRGPKGYRAKHTTPKYKNASGHPDTQNITIMGYYIILF